jgi:high-affinity nickel permease
VTDAIILGLGSTFLFGLRHGVDYDHIAAISDLTSIQPDHSRAFRLGLTYAIGHACVVCTLGITAVAFGSTLPASWDKIMERIVGVTLIVLGVYVVLSLRSGIRDGTAPASRSQLIRRMLGSRYAGSDRRSAFVIGTLHGIGAETPTQLGLFLFAAGVGGIVVGALGVVFFVTGLLITNSVMCAIATSAIARRRVQWQRSFAALSAAYSLGVGLTFLFG